MGLQRGRTEAAERPPVEPVDEATIEATLRHLPSVVADMVRLQRLTGCRPGEICGLRPCDIDQTGPIWVYRPAWHKTQHRGHSRQVFVGPKARRFCDATSNEGLTHSASRRRRASGAASETCEHVAKRKCSRRSSIDERSGRGSSPVSDTGKTPTAGRFTRRAGRRSQPPRASRPRRIEPGTKRHRWSPNQLRHAAATEIRRRYGLEAAQVILGHSRADVTQLYAERDQGLAVEVMAKIG